MHCCEILQESDGMLHKWNAVEGFPAEFVLMEGHICVRGVFFWNGNRTAVKIVILVSEQFASRDMRVSGEKIVTLLKGRRRLGRKLVTMRGVNEVVFEGDDSIICKNREAEHHLIDLGITVPSDTKQALGEGIEHGNDFFRGIILR